MGNDQEIFKRALAREKAARKQAEKILEDKSRELYFITQQLKEANEQLEDLVDVKESELQGVFDNLVDAYVLMDLHGNVQEMNQAAVELFGYDVRNEKLNVVQLIYKEDYEYAMTSFFKLTQDGFFSDYQARVYTKHNGVRTVHINASIIKDKNKKPIAAQGIVRDITTTLEQQRIFENQRQQLSVIVENSSLGIVLTQMGKILQTNKAFQDLLQYSQEELLEMNVQEISMPDEYKESEENMKKMTSGEIGGFSINKRYRKKNGGIFWAKTSVAAVRKQNGDMQYQVALIEDITDQREHEKQRDLLLKNLEKSNKELNDYAHIVSHDLKSPLRSMNALITWLKEDYESVLDEGAQQSFDMLLKKVDKMDHLINGILEYSSVDKGEHIQKTIDLNSTVKDIIDIIYIPDHIEVTVTSDLPVVQGDNFRLQQLFQNLINNAVKYNDKEKGWIKVSCIPQKTHWQFAIEDNGPGIPKKYHEKIFRVFQTLDDNKESTGVGLSIVKKIIDLYDGKIWVTSEEGKGTAFHFTLKK
ncbi:sensor histidine kinase [Aquimarina spongiae]|uniref:histidine kinase n=1 Tax=Aquimarina spongiae TaxID=570521 RepID=A0A1M6J6J7_9FLAO|nr:PAS domain-containing sensor histidine kinase [Aquimarina spongiae]SHJ42302.1 PAS domain S-box-containing protein [Aquimarina spongiae]